MRLALALGVALMAVTASASAQPEPTRVFIRHHGGSESRDANNDGWVTRDEAQAGADRLFDELDRNDDGRLNDADHEGRDHVFQFRLDGEPGAHAPLAMQGENCSRSEEGSGDDRRVTIICRGDGQHPGPNWEARVLDDDDCTREESGTGSNRRVTVTCTREEHERRESSGDGERRVDRTVIIRRGDHGGDHEHGDSAHPAPPMPPMPPHPPVMMMRMGDREEFDRNGDGALSREEFRAQQLAYFDASDGNDDGRVRAVRPPEPPVPPEPPTPPAPPTPQRR